MSLRRRALFLLGLFVAVSCSDAGNPLEPGPRPQPEPRDDAIQALQCSVDIPTSTMQCAPRDPDAGGAQAAQMITGGQRKYVVLTASNFATGANSLEFDVTVQNLMRQALGTEDGTTLDSAGVRVWFAAEPANADVALMDSTGMLLGGPTPYFQYDTILRTDETSDPKRWRFENISPGATNVQFFVYVVAHVQFPNGWVEITPNPVLLAPGDSIDLSGVAYAPRADSASAVHQTLTWSSDNPAIAEVTNASTGMVKANALGTATVTATNNTPGNGSPVKQSGTVTVIVNSPVQAVDDSVDAVANVPIFYPDSVGLLRNDTDADSTSQDLWVVEQTVVTANGTAQLDSTGSFTYLSNAGFSGVDVVPYTVTDGTDEDQGTLTVTVGQRYWYVQPGAASNGDGRRDTPFNTLAAADAASSGTEPILVLGGGGAPAAGAGIVLDNGQHIIGQGISAHLTTTLVGGQVNLTLLQSTGVSPTIRANAGATVTLGQNNTIRGVIVESASGAAITGSNFGTLTASEMVTLSATGGPALNLTSGTLNNVTVLTLSSTNSTSTGLSLTQVGGSLTANGGTIQGSAGNAVTVAGDSATAITYAGNVRQKTAGMALLSVSGNHTGTLTFNVGALADSAGTGLQFSGADGTYNFNGATTLVGSTAGIGITGGSNGTFAFSASTLIEGNGLLVQDSEPNLTYPGTITTTSGRPVEVNGASPCGSITVSGNISSTASGILVQDCNAGTVSFTGAKTLNTGTNAALTLSNNTGTASVSLTGGALSITTSTGAGILGNGAGGFGSLTVSNATVNATNGPALSLTNGTLNATFASLTSTNSATNGVTLTTVNGTLNTSGGSISGAAGTAFNVSGGNLAGTIATSISQGNNASLLAVAGGHNTGTLTFSAAVSATNGNGLQFTDADGTYTFTGNFTLDGAGDEGIDMGASSTGTVNVTPSGGNTAAINSPSGIAISIAGGSLNYSGNVTQASNAALLSVTGGAGGHTGTVTFPSGTLNASNGSGLQFDNADGVYDFDGTVTLVGGDAGIDVTNGSDGTFTFPGTTTITSPSTGNLISILNSVSPFSFTYSGALTKANNNVTGILISNNSGSTITFDGDATSADGDPADVARSISSGTAAAVNLSSNSGSTINFNGGGLNITTTSGAGFTATGGGTVQVTGAGNTIQTGSGTALNLNGIGTGGSGINLLSVTSTGAANGISATSVTGAGLQVTGNGGTCTIATPTCTGGYIQSSTGTGVALSSVSTVILTRLRVQGSGTHGISTTGSTNLTLNSTYLQSNGNGDEENGLYVLNNTGTVMVDASSFNGAAENLIRVDNNNANLTFTVQNGSTFEFPNPETSAFRNSAILITPKGSSAITALVTGSTFRNIPVSSFQAAPDASVTSTSTYTFTNNTLSADVGLNVLCSSNPQCRVGNVVAGGTGGTTHFIATGNNFNRVNGDGVFILGANQSSTLRVRVDNNTISNALDDAFVVGLGQSARVIAQFNANNVSNLGADALEVASGETNAAFGAGSASDMDLVFTNNTMTNVGTNPSLVATGGPGIFRFGDSDQLLCLAFTGNTVSPTPGTTGISAYFDGNFGALGGTMTYERAGAGALTAAMVKADNPGLDLAGIVVSSVNTSNGATCQRPGI